MYTHIYIYSGGTEYIIEGENLHVAQTRHLVFYIVEDQGEFELDVRRRKQNFVSDRSLLKQQAKIIDFVVPQPTLAEGGVTKCLTTWDINSQVNIEHLNGQALSFNRGIKIHTLYMYVHYNYHA